MRSGAVRPVHPVSEELKDTFKLVTFHSGFLKLAILKLLSARPMHGYGLMKEIGHLSENSWNPSPGSIYPTLRELQGSGLIEQERIGRRRVYQLTPKGKDVLDDAIAHTQNGIRSLQNLLDFRPPED
jgi:DNA-binding PadR family transcriptional regulator